jgi:hypothetical protein
MAAVAARHAAHLLRNGIPMSEAKRFLQNSRKCFFLVGEARDAKGRERSVAMGRDYLQLAHDAAKVKTDTKSPRDSELGEIAMAINTADAMSAFGT